MSKEKLSKKKRGTTVTYKCHFKKQGCLGSYKSNAERRKHMKECHIWCYEDEGWLLAQPGSEEETEHIRSCPKCKGMHQL